MSEGSKEQSRRQFTRRHNKWSHAKCLRMSRTTFQYYLNLPDLEWVCATCTLPPSSDSFFANDSIEESPNTTVEVNQSTKRIQERPELLSIAERAPEYDDTIPDNAARIFKETQKQEYINEPVKH